MVQRPLTHQQQSILMRALNPARVQQRSQGGTTLNYLEAWDIRATLIRVFGYGGFSSELLDYQIVDIRDVPKSRGDGTNSQVTVSARVRLTIHQLGAIYTEAAVSSQTHPVIGDAADFALKTAESDALKRCAINLGTQYGLSLYSDGATTDVVRVVFAPGQEWPRPAETPKTPEPAPGMGHVATPDEEKVAEPQLSDEPETPAPEPPPQDDMDRAEAIIKSAFSADKGGAK